MAINPQGSGQGMRNRPEEIGAAFQRTAEETAHKARDAAQTAGHQAQEAGASIKHRAEEALGSVGQQMSSLGGALRDKAPREGMLGNAAASVAGSMQTGGRYLQEHDLDDMGREVSNMVRRYPLASVAACFGLGCLVGITWNRR